MGVYVPFRVLALGFWESCNKCYMVRKLAKFISHSC